MTNDIEVRKIVLLPRFTSFVGATSFASAPVNIREFASARVVAWVGEGLGTDPAFQLEIQESPDLSIWNTVLTLTPADEDEEAGDAEFTREWMRVVATLSGTSPFYTCWAVGDFVTRAARK